MNSSILCVFLLTWLTICTSTRVRNCQCVKTSQGVKPSLIAEVKDYPPSPYCSKQEVIATLKDGREACLDPESNFTKAALRAVRLTAEARRNEIKTTRPRTTTAAHVL